ncbi:MAG: hypothetical protein ACRENS_11160 [Candidatus Eiseniibacteriota bacterium]
MRLGRSEALRKLTVAGSLAGAVVFALFRNAPAARADVLPVTLAAEAKPAAGATAAPAAAPKKSGKKARQPKAATAKTPSPKHVHDPEAGAWDKGALWVTLRAGFNQASYSTAGNGSVGYGFGFTHMLSPEWGFAGLAERNVLGYFGDATESEIPFTLEFDRHIKMSETFRAYLGAGGGVYYHKFSNTTADHSDVRSGGFFAGGGNIVVTKHSLFGLDGRIAGVTTKADAPTDNPVFGSQKSTTMRWSIKASWSVTY